jgi:hypothetical protein
MAVAKEFATERRTESCMASTELVHAPSAAAETSQIGLVSPNSRRRGIRLSRLCRTVVRGEHRPITFVSTAQSLSGFAFLRSECARF